MTTKTDQSKQEEGGEFGLPQVEFKPIAARGRQWFKITTIIVGLVLTVGASVVYWFFYYSPTKGIAVRHEKQENETLQSGADPMYKNTFSKLKTGAGEEKVKPLKLDENSKAPEKREATKGPSAKNAIQSHAGTITRINIAQGCYYIVLGSFVDKDLASDYAHQLIQKGVGITLIAPPKGQYYFRIAIKQGKNFRNAYEKVKALKATYGPDIWVMKY